jgi:hypothetical protein
LDDEIVVVNQRMNLLVVVVEHEKLKLMELTIEQKVE